MHEALSIGPAKAPYGEISLHATPAPGERVQITLRAQGERRARTLAASAPAEPAAAVAELLAQMQIEGRAPDITGDIWTGDAALQWEYAAQWLRIQTEGETPRRRRPGQRSAGFWERRKQAGADADAWTRKISAAAIAGRAYSGSAFAHACTYESCSAQIAWASKGFRPELLAEFYQGRAAFWISGKRTSETDFLHELAARFGKGEWDGPPCEVCQTATHPDSRKIGPVYRTCYTCPKCGRIGAQL